MNKTYRTMILATVLTSYSAKRLLQPELEGTDQWLPSDCRDKKTTCSLQDDGYWIEDPVTFEWDFKPYLKREVIKNGVEDKVGYN